MSLTRSVEYDAFGPWILPVAGLDDVPRAFRDYPFDFDADFTLKIPRDIARRDATPSMHLYDRMLVVGESGLTVLSREGDSFLITAIAGRNIAAVENGSELLDGWLIVHSLDGTRVEVPYNGTSKHIIARVASRLIELAGGAGGERATSQVLELDALGGGDVALVNAYREQSAGLRLYAAYGAMSPVSKESLIARIRKGAPQLSGAVMFGNDRQLIVLSRRDWLRFRGKPELSTRSTVVVRARVTAVATSVHPLVAGVTIVTVRLGKAAITFEVPDASDAAKVLSAS